MSGSGTACAYATYELNNNILILIFKKETIQNYKIHLSSLTAPITAQSTKLIEIIPIICSIFQWFAYHSEITTCQMNRFIWINRNRLSFFYSWTSEPQIHIWNICWLFIVKFFDLFAQSRISTNASIYWYEYTIWKLFWRLQFKSSNDIHSI